MASDEAPDESANVSFPAALEPVLESVALDGSGDHGSGGTTAAVRPAANGARNSAEQLPAAQAHPFLQRVTGRPLATLPPEARPAIDALRRLTNRFAAKQPSAPAPSQRDEQYATVSVERDDSIAAICGKLDATRLNRVAVLVAGGNAELSRPIGMRLLMRHAELTGKEIILVSRSQSVRQRAHAEGQQYVRRERALRFDARETPALQLGGLDLPLPGRSALLALAALGGFSILAFAAVFWYLPVATVTLSLPSTQVSDEQPLTLDEQANRLNPASLLVPATRRQISVTRTVYLPASGNPSADTSDGQGPSRASVTDNDLKSAQDLATSAIREQGVEDLRNRFGAEETFFPSTAQVQVLSVEPREHAGDPADFLQVTYRGSASVVATRTSDLKQLFTERLRQQVGRDRQLIDGSLTVTTVKAGAFDPDAQKLPVQMRGEASSAALLNTTKIQRLLLGRSRHDALEALDREAGVIRTTDIHVSPGWAPWFPRITSHIHLRFRAGGGA
jgi:hypothetical protein